MQALNSAGVFTVKLIQNLNKQNRYIYANSIESVFNNKFSKNKDIAIFIIENRNGKKMPKTAYP